MYDILAPNHKMVISFSQKTFVLSESLFHFLQEMNFFKTGILQENKM
jgi:hypothetical protein